MKQTLSTNHAAHLLTQDPNANWSYRGAIALVKYLEELEEETGEEREFDAVAIRCDFDEFADLLEFAVSYFGSLGNVADKFSLHVFTDEINDAIRDFIQDHGTLIEFDGGVIISSF
jgi:hypothetical protein